jgi:hypothetical protein
MSGTSSRVLSHDEAFAELGALALGALDPNEEREVMGHVAECRECREELEVLREITSSMPVEPSLGTMPPDRSAEIRASLVERASSESVQRPASNLWKVLSVAATIAVAVLGAAWYREYQANIAMGTRIAAANATADSLALAVREKEDQLAAMTGPGVSVVELSSSATRAPAARMFWDRTTNRWTMYAHRLPALQPGRAYELWLVTADTKIPAGTFKPGADGSATFTAVYELRPEDLKAIAVTEEPEAGVPSPTGPIILLGTAEAS